MKVEQCPYISVIEIAQYLCREIQVNSKSGHVKEIRNLLTSYNKGGMAAQKALSSMTPFGRAFVQSTPSHSLLFSAAISDKIEGRIKAYTKWKGLVAAGCPWDHKKAIQRLQGYQHWSCDKNKHFLFFYDLWSNIHYGFIGKAVGFTEWELTAGAGVAQLKDNKRSWGTWASQYLQNRIRELGDADFLAAFDDASDNEAIKIGFRLYDRYGGTPSFLTAQAILDEIYKSYQNNKLVNIKKCPNH